MPSSENLEDDLVKEINYEKLDDLDAKALNEDLKNSNENIKK